MRRSLPCLLPFAFFGLKASDRSSIFSQIHEIVFHGNGGYDWYSVYNMPIWLRKFTFMKLKEHFEAINDTNKQPQKTKSKVHRPDIKPSYTTKASSK